MKNYFAPEGSKLTLDSNGEQTIVDLYSRAGFEMLTNLWVKVGAQHRVMYEPTWLGRPIIQFPSDVVAVQELLWTVQPDVVIETGIAHGGSLVLSASMLELIGKGRVIEVDIDIRAHNRAALDAHPLRKRIELIEGSSIKDETIATVRQLVGDAKTVLVMLDSNHTREHVLQELIAYSPLVTQGSYIVVHDGSQEWVWEIPRGNPEWQGNGPLDAVNQFLEMHPEFSVDEHYTRFGITSSYKGYLKRSPIHKMGLR